MGVQNFDNEPGDTISTDPPISVRQTNGGADFLTALRLLKNKQYKMVNAWGFYAFHDDGPAGFQSNDPIPFTFQGNDQNGNSWQPMTTNAQFSKFQFAWPDTYAVFGTFTQKAMVNNMWNYSNLNSTSITCTG